jgi:hypothetical protein
MNRDGVAVALKPDLFCSLMSKTYEDYYFFEVDRSTENPARVIRKCHQYEQYLQTGAEQQRLGVFPAVVWLVPGARRQEQLRRYIGQDDGLTKDLFSIITLEQLGELVRGGTGGLNAEFTLDKAHALQSVPT